MKTLSKIVFILLTYPLFAMPSAERTPNWKDKVRVKTLENMDLLLSLSVSRKQNPYPLAQPTEQETLNASLPEIASFANEYSYFSLTRPIIGKVSSRQADLKKICALLQTLQVTSLRGSHFELACGELLTKCLAYRDLKRGNQLQIPIEKQGGITLETFTVDHVFDIWQGMPAFGLIPEKDNLSSLLLFRGTDFSLITKRGIASVMSDLDPSGPGLRAFFHARKEIRSWLQLVQARGNPARVMGFSLGGALAAYTFIYENSYLSEEPSLSVCAPGVASSVIKAWNRLPANRKELFVSYINVGDLVSQFGSLFGTVYCLSTKEPMRPLTAHTTLMCAQAPLYKTRIDTTKSPFKGTAGKSKK